MDQSANEFLILTVGTDSNAEICIIESLTITARTNQNTHFKHPLFQVRFIVK